MIIGVPKEIKKGEHRVAMGPNSVHELISYEHEVLVEAGAGFGIGFDDDAYRHAGAKIVSKVSDVFSNAEMIIKVKEPQESEYKQLREGQVLFTYLHLAPDPDQAKGLIDSGCIAIAYETVTDRFGGLPLLAPMSEVAGRLSIQAGAYCLEKAHGGKGILLGGVPGVSRGNVLVIGGGVVGTNAIRMAMGKEANVTVLDKSVRRLQELDLQFGSKLNTIFATKITLEEYITQSDLVVCAVLVPGGAAPKLITRDMLKMMRKGSVIVDVAIDQGGCCEASKATTHDEPTYIIDGVVHYCVANMPGAVPRTSAFALNNATLPFIIELANKGYRQAMLDDPHLMNGLNIYKGKVTCKPVAESLGMEYFDANLLL